MTRELRFSGKSKAIVGLIVSEFIETIDCLKTYTEMASNLPNLTKGAIQKMKNNERVDRPVLQVMLYKQMGGENNAQKKYRFQMTDGADQLSSFIVVLPELIHRIERGEFEKYTVVEVVNYSLNQQPAVDRQIIILNEMVTLMAGSKIGKRLECSAQTPGLLSAVNQNKPMTPSRSSTTNSNNRNICPIVAITPYFNAWQIKARVTSKAPKKVWSNARGEGTVFSFDVMDQSGEIRISAFNKEVDKYHDLIQVGKVYYITKGTVKTANKKFSNLSNDYEITLQSDSIIEECDDSSNDEMPKMRFKFIKIRDLMNISPQTVVDVIGVVKSYEDCVTINSKKTNKELRKRDITLVDNTAHEVRFTLWNEMAEQFDCAPESVLAIKNCLVGDFNGRNIGSVSSTTIHIEPDIPETNLLKDWYSREGHRVNIQALSKPSGEGARSNETRFTCQINEQSVSNEGRVYFNVKGRITSTGRTPLYKACGQNGCLKKVQENNNGFYRCEKCQTDSPNFEWRIILSVAISDCTGDMWITLFQEQAEKLLGISAKDLSELQENDPQMFLKTLASIEFKQFVFRVGARMEQYMDETRVKSAAYNFTPIDPIKHSKDLIQKIKKWNE